MYDESVHHTRHRRGAAVLDGARGVQATGLGKRFGDLWALRDLHLDVTPGTVLGLLGHNGAGKTTAIRILTTLSQPTTGSATVAGYDVVTHGRPGAPAHRCRRPAGHRRRAAHRAGEPGDGRAPLPPAQAGGPGPGRRAARACSTSTTPPIGWSRRTPAACAVGSTSPPASWPGPRCCSSTSRRPGSTRAAATTCGTLLRALVRDGTTLILTTQYLEEADRLADDIVVLDHGRAVATGHARGAQGAHRQRPHRRHRGGQQRAGGRRRGDRRVRPGRADVRPRGADGHRPRCARARG